MVLGWLRKKVHDWRYVTLAGAMSVFCGCGEDTKITEQQKWKINPDTQVLTAEDVKDVISVDSDYTIKFKGDSKYAEELGGSSIIVTGVSNQFPYGALRRVRSIKKEEEIKVKTEQATLEDMIEEGTLEGRISFSDDFIAEAKDGLTFGKETKRSPLTFEGKDSLGELAFQVEEEIVPGIGFNANLNAKAYLEFFIDIKRFNVQKLDVALGFNQEFSGNVYFNYRDNLDKKKTFHPLPEGVLPTITFYIPTLIPIPVVIVPEFSVTAGVEASGVLARGFEFSETFTGIYGVRYQANKWKDTSEHGGIDFSGEKLNSGSPRSQADAEAYLTPKLAFKLYKVGGITGAARGSIGVSVNAQSWDMNACLDILVGLEASVLGRSLGSYEESVYERCEEIFKENFVVGNTPPEDEECNRQPYARCENGKIVHYKCDEVLRRINCDYGCQSNPAQCNDAPQEECTPTGVLHNGYCIDQRRIAILDTCNNVDHTYNCPDGTECRAEEPGRGVCQEVQGGEGEGEPLRGCGIYRYNGRVERIESNPLEPGADESCAQQYGGLVGSQRTTTFYLERNGQQISGRDTEGRIYIGQEIHAVDSPPNLVQFTSGRDLENGECVETGINFVGTLTTNRIEGRVALSFLSPREGESVCIAGLDRRGCILVIQGSGPRTGNCN